MNSAKLRSLVISVNLWGALTAAIGIVLLGLVELGERGDVFGLEATLMLAVILGALLQGLVCPFKRRQ
ncbi:MAG: hypothetical protein R3C68_11240 [Myxococcota bacterium]